MARKNNMKEIGYTGLDQWSGVIQEDFLRELRGKEGFKRYQEMRLNSPVVGAMLLAIEQAVRGITWQYVSDDGEDDERIAFLQASLDGMSTNWADHVIEALSMLPFGYAPFEIVYQRGDGGRLVWRKFGIRGQDTVNNWLLDDNGGLQGVVQMGAPSYKRIEIPIEKLILYRTRSEKNNPEGRSVLRSAWVPYYYAKNIMQIEAIGIERDLAGMPVVMPPMGATVDESDSTSDVSKAAEFVRNIRNDEQAGLVLPPPVGEGDHQRWHFELASTGGTRNFDTNAVVMRYESRILMSALSQFLILGQDKVGTQALSADMTEFWTNSINATADIISETHTAYAMKRLLTLNGLDAEGIRLEHSPAGDVDLSMLADVFQKVGDKITWLPSDEMWLRGAMKLPKTTQDEIQAEQEARRERALEMRPQFQPSNPFEQRDENATYFAAGTAPDDAQRRRYEARLERLVQAYWNDQKARALKSAKRVKRGTRL